MRQEYGEKRMGGEVEAWVSDAHDICTPRNVPELIGHLNGSINPLWGTVTVEPGDGSIEFVGGVAKTPRGAARKISRICKAVAMHEIGSCAPIAIHTTMRSPFPLKRINGPRIQKPRYRAIWEATRKEAVGCGYSEKQWADGLDAMNIRAATHLTFSWSELEISTRRIDDRIVFMKSFIDHFGPRVARILCEHYGVHNDGHLGIWHGWAHPGRFSCQHNQWSARFEHLKARFESLKRLVVNTSASGKDDDGWMVDLEHPLEWVNLQDHGSGWWPFCRPKLVDGKNGMLELRLLPSWPIEKLGDVFADLDRLVSLLLDVAETGTECRTVAAFVRSRAWQQIRSVPIVGDTYLPDRYSRQARDRDIFY